MLGTAESATNDENSDFFVAKCENLSIRKVRSANRRPLERMKTKTKASPGPAKPEPAGLADIRQAVDALTHEDTERIRQSAQNRIYWIGPYTANGRTAQELVNEAYQRILDGRRKWYKERVDFTKYLIGVIRSIASEWAGYHERNKDENLPEFAQLESQLSKIDDDGKQIPPFDHLADIRPTAEQALIRAEREAEDEALVKEIECTFGNDDKASMVILGIEDGMNGPAIRAEFQMSEQDYKAAMRRIRYGVNKILEKRNGRQGA